ncbi:MAG: hypothetical protein J7M26_02595 [Armatimonadetes bacterium]|nr:hypothetical protein [Armatimonadota bacterium]
MIPLSASDLLPAALVAAFAVGTKFCVDLVARTWRRLRGKPLPSWAKQALSLAIAAAMTVQARVDIFEGLRGAPTPTGYLLTALVLAGVASEVAHPAIETAKRAGKRLRS